MEGLLCLLDEALSEHDNNRKEIQDEAQDISSQMIDEANQLEEKINEDIQESLNSYEDNIYSLIEQLTNSTKEDESLMELAQIYLYREPKYEIQRLEGDNNFVDSYRLKIFDEITFFNINEGHSIEDIIDRLQELLVNIHDSIAAAQDKLTEIVTERKSEAEGLEKMINERLESVFSKEDARIQEAVNLAKEKSYNCEDIEKIKSKVKLTLFVSQKYSLDEYHNIIVRKKTSLKAIDFEERKPSNLTSSFINIKEFSLSFSFFNDEEIKLLNSFNKLFKVMINIWRKDKSEENAKTLAKEYKPGNQQILFEEQLFPNTTYCVKMRIKYSTNDCLFTQWSDEITEFTIPDFEKIITWKECPSDVDLKRKYSLNKKNARIATKTSGGWSTVVGVVPLPQHKITSWSIKILSSWNNDGEGIFIGVAPLYINQTVNNNDYCGWYFNCNNSTLHSGPPHNYSGKEYGPRKEKDGKYIHTGGSVGVVMDTNKGELSFVLNGVNLGVAFEGIPFDKPLAPCVLLLHRNDSVEFVI